MGWPDAYIYLDNRRPAKVAVYSVEVDFDIKKRKATSADLFESKEPGNSWSDIFYRCRLNHDF